MKDDESPTEVVKNLLQVKQMIIDNGLGDIGAKEVALALINQALLELGYDDGFL